MIYLWNTGTSSVGLNMDTFWLMFSGAVTAIPLILFSAGAKRIPLSLTGFIQYVGPTIMFFLGIFAFKEHFDATIGYIRSHLVRYRIVQYFSIRENET